MTGITIEFLKKLLEEVTPGNWDITPSNSVGVYNEGRYEWSSIADFDLPDRDADPSEAEENAQLLKISKILAQRIIDTETNQPCLPEFIAKKELDWAKAWGWDDFDVEQFREALAVLNPVGRGMSVSKHQIGVNFVSFVIQNLDAHDLRVPADTLRWMMWHSVVTDDRERLLLQSHRETLEERNREIASLRKELSNLKNK